MVEKMELEIDETEVVKMEEEKRTAEVSKKPIKSKLYLGLVLLLVLIIAGMGLYIALGEDKEEVKPAVVSFKDIGLLVTQESRSTALNNIEDAREVDLKLIKFKIPATRSQIIYGFDVVVKAGIDFEKIEWEIKNSKIEVTVPKAFVTDKYVDPDSRRYYYQNESIFTNITDEEANKLENKKFKETVEQIVESGLCQRAEKNAEVIIKNFFLKEEQYKDYEIIIDWI